MIAVSNEWIENQKKQLRSESNVRITFFEIDNYKIVSTLGSVDKETLSSFNFTESGSVLCDKLYDVEINFSLLKNTQQNDFPEDSLVKIEFGYLLNGTWEYIDRGYFEIVRKTNKRNSNVIEYTLKHLNYILLSMQNALGMPCLQLNSTTYSGRSPKNLFNCTVQAQIQGFANVLKANFIKGAMVAEGSLNNFTLASTNPYYYRISADIEQMSYLEILQLLAGICAGTYKIFGKVENNEYKTSFTMLDTAFGLKASMFSYHEFKFNDINFTKFPEIITLDTYKKLTYISSKDENSNYQTLTISNTKYGSVKKGEKYYYPNSNLVYSGTVTNIFLFTKGFIPLADIATFSSDLTVYSSLKTTTTLVSSDFVGKGQLEKNIQNPLSSMDNNSITDYSVVTYNNWANTGNKIQFELRIDPRFELFDNFDYIDENGIKTTYLIERYTISYNGSFKGTIEARRWKTTPILSNLTINENGSQFSFDITNTNEVSCRVRFVDESGNSIYYPTGDLQPNGTNTYNQSGANTNLKNKFLDYKSGTLTENVYVIFTIKTSTTIISSRTLLLEANNI